MLTIIVGLGVDQAAGHDRMDWLWRKSSHMPQAQGWICLDDSPDDHIPRPSWEAHTYSLRTLGQMWWRTKTWLAFGVFGMVFEKCLGCIKSSRLSLIIAMYAELPLLQGDVNLATDVSWSMTQVGMGSKNDIFEMEAYHKIHEFYSFTVSLPRRDVESFDRFFPLRQPCVLLWTMTNEMSWYLLDSTDRQTGRHLLDSDVVYSTKLLEKNVKIPSFWTQTKT